MIIVLSVLFGVALFAPLVFTRLGRNAFYGLAVFPAGAFVWLLFQYPAVYSGGISEHIDWIPQLGLDLTFRMDPLSWVLSLLILGVGALVLAYCARYFKTDAPGIGAFGAQLLAFAGVMFGLVTSDDLILMFVFWELTTILSYVLIGYARTKITARRSAIQALVVTTAGGLTMLIGLIMLASVSGSGRISVLLERAPALVHDAGTSSLVSVAVVLVLVGAITKSALFPFHFWLPGAMAAPTPVSAYLHAAAMVKAGVYLVARFAPGFHEANTWLPVILVLGLVTMLVGGYRALRQFDIKLILAYGTVSQLGFITLIVGLGTPEAALAGLALVVGHALFKATLFLVVGIIDHQTGTRDVRKLSGVFRSSRALGLVATAGAASMAGLPFFAGFIAKESAYTALWSWAEHSDLGVWAWLLLAGVVLGSMLTFAYSARFIWGAFATKPGCRQTPFKSITPAFIFAPAVLAILGVVYGVWPQPVDSWIQPYAALFAAPGDAHGAGHLVLWHGFTPALWLTVLTIAVGVLLVWGKDWVSRFQDAMPKVPDADKVYQGVIGLLDDFAVWLTGRTQRGSLFFYLSVILSVAILAPLTVLIFHGQPIPGNGFWIDPGSPFQWIIALAIMVGAIGAVRANKRFMGVLLVSVTGYGIALIFALQGAPDLALTQMLVESLALVAFILAMRRLQPGLRDRTGGRFRVVRVTLGVAFGTMMVFVAMYAMGARTHEPVSLKFPKLAYEGGGGLNVVNVTLVDIRAWDTFGEISVLALAATGVASLLFVRSIGQRIGRSATVATGSIGRVPSLGEGDYAEAALATARRFGSSTDEGTQSGSATGTSGDSDPQPAGVVSSGEAVHPGGTVRADDSASPAEVSSGEAGSSFSQKISRKREKHAARRQERIGTTDPDSPWIVAGRTLAPERRSILFEVVTRLIFHTMIVISIYLLLAGHNTPGGGFAGGLLAGMALTIRYLAGGRFELAEAARMSPGNVIGLGLALAAVSGLAPLFFGGNVFQSAILTFDLPIFGDVKFVTSTFFDIGVYIVVIGLVLDVLRSLGAQVDTQIEEEEAKA